MSTIMIMLITAGVLLLILGVGFRERLARIFKAKANILADKLEDPTEIANQIVRELNENLQKAIEGEAQIKTIVLSNKAKQVEAEQRAASYKDKTNKILDRVEAKTLDSIHGNELAGESDKLYQSALDEAKRYQTIAEDADKKEKIMAEQVKSIRNSINSAKTKTIEIDARQKAASAMELVNKTLLSVDVNGLTATLDRMDEKAKFTQNKADAYAQIDGATRSTEDEINAAVSGTSTDDALVLFMKENRTK